MNFERNLKKMGEEYNKPIDEETHFKHIENLATELTNKYGDYLKGGKFRIGIAQKALNLYLKYLWCAGFTPMPPHCPFDRIIIDAIKEKNWKPQETNWTEMDNIDTYKKCVEAAKKAANGKPIAEWELEIWSESKLFIERLTEPMSFVEIDNDDKKQRAKLLKRDFFGIEKATKKQNSLRKKRHRTARNR